MIEQIKMTDKVKVISCILYMSYYTVLFVILIYPNECGSVEGYGWRHIGRLIVVRNKNDLYCWSPLGGVLPLSFTNPSLSSSHFSVFLSLSTLFFLFLTSIMTKLSTEIYGNMGPKVWKVLVFG